MRTAETDEDLGKGREGASLSLVARRTEVFRTVEPRATSCLPETRLLIDLHGPTRRRRGDVQSAELSGEEGGAACAGYYQRGSRGPGLSVTTSKVRAHVNKPVSAENPWFKPGVLPYERLRGSRN